MDEMDELRRTFNNAMDIMAHNSISALQFSA